MNLDNFGFGNILPCTSVKEDWSTTFNEKYPLVLLHKEDSQCGAVYMAAILSSNANNNVQEDPRNIMKQHLDVKLLDDGNNLFLGIYDCNGRGRSASVHAKDHLFNELSRLVQENDNNMSEDIIKRAFSSVENTFMESVENTYDKYKKRIEDGSCCIASIIWGRTLYIANLGDSRAVLGSNAGTFKTLHIEQLTNDHSVSNEAVREDLQAHSPYDSNVVQHNMERWIASNIKVNRSIGYAHLKNHPINSLQRIPEIKQIIQVLVSAEPELHSRKIRKGDRFLILASHGFWNFMTNEKAANIVNRNPRDEIAKRLLSAALEKATKKKGAEGVYDDMIIIVLFFSEGLSQRIEEDTPKTKTVVLQEGPSYLRNIIMASGKSDQSRQPTLTQRSSEFRSGIHQSGQHQPQEMKIEQQRTQHQPRPQPQLPMSTIQVLEAIGKYASQGHFKVELEKNIFGQVYIEPKDVIQFAKQDNLKNDFMNFYVRYLHKEIIRPRKLLNKFSFLHPKFISEVVLNRERPQQISKDSKEKYAAIATIFLQSQKFKDKLILAPCNLGNFYWVLIVINVNAGTIYYLDSLNSENTNYPGPIKNVQYNFNTHLKDRAVLTKSKNFEWIKTKCPKQPDPIPKDSGYYVMKFMKDIITSANEIPCLPDTYSNDDLDEVKTDCASYLINSITS